MPVINGSGSTILDSFGACVRQSRNLRGILEHARGRGVQSIRVQVLNDGPTRPGALVTVNYCGGHAGHTYFSCGSHAQEWANKRRDASPRASWFAGCLVKVDHVPAGAWSWDNAERKAEA